MNNILDNFRLKKEKEDFKIIATAIDNGVVFRGTNLWILIFAIFVASLGLNVNSTAVIIGAMLISPLMGPIMGLGFSMGINDLVLLRKAFYNYLFAAGVGLTTSTIYFLLSPINSAHSEILARTSPNIYDVLIAFFGGLAGILAVSSKQKGNVIPGVAIATALMPPLCTAGYGLATFQLPFFLGALYLFIINTVFIALAALITIRLLKFPYKQLPDPNEALKSKRIIGAITIITILPSIYFGYDIVQKANYSETALRFINNEAIFTDDYLLQKNIDPKQEKITLTYGGKKISAEDIAKLKAKLKNYALEETTLEIQQGFAYLTEKKDNEKEIQLRKAMAEKESELHSLQEVLDSIKLKDTFKYQLFKEAKAIYPDLKTIALSTLHSLEKSEEQTQLVYVQFSNESSETKIPQLENWLNTKLNKKVKVVIGE